MNKTNKATARLTAAQLQRLIAKADRRAAALERQNPAIKGDNARINALYS